MTKVEPVYIAARYKPTLRNQADFLLSRAASQTANMTNAIATLLLRAGHQEAASLLIDITSEIECRHL